CAGPDRAARDAALVPHDPEGERRVIPSGWERLDTHDGRPPCPLNLDRSLEVADTEPRARWEHFAPIEVFQYDVLHPPAPFHRDCAAEEGEGDQGPDPPRAPARRRPRRQAGCRGGERFDHYVVPLG